MRIVLPLLRSFVLSMSSLLHGIKPMVSVWQSNTCFESSKYLQELDNFLPKFLSGELSMEDQARFIQTVIDLDLQDRYDLHQECKYFVLEGLCYEVFLGDD